MPRVRQVFPTDYRTIKHTRKGDLIAFERIIPRSHTEIHLTPRGMAALQALPQEKKRLLSLDLTGGGGYSLEYRDREGRIPKRAVIDISAHDTEPPVHRRWSKIRGMLEESYAGLSPEAQRAEYRKWQKSHPNLMTPRVLSLKTKGKSVVELSKGQGILGSEDLFGVTKLTKVGAGTFKSAAFGNKLFRNETEARKYAKKMMRGIR